MSNKINYGTIVVYGEPASKANSRKIVKIKGRPVSIKSDKARAYEKSFKEQMEKLASRQLLEGDVKVDILIYYKTRRPELDESLILDCLQGYIYKNDRQVKEKHIYWGIDKDSPRTILRVSTMETGNIPSYLRRLS